MKDCVVPKEMEVRLTWTEFSENMRVMSFAVGAIEGLLMTGKSEPLTESQRHALEDLKVGLEVAIDTGAAALKRGAK